MFFGRTALLFAALVGLAAAQPAQTPPPSGLLAQQSSPTDHSEHLQDPDWLGPFVPTPMPVVVAALELADVGKNDVVYDLGSGDGRIVLAAVQKFQANSVGVEWSEALCKKTSAAIKRLGFENRVKVIQGDIFQQDVSAATVVTGYLLPKSWERLVPILERQLRNGTRVVSVNDRIPGWPVVAKKQIPHESRNTPWEVYLYRIGQ